MKNQFIVQDSIPINNDHGEEHIHVFEAGAIDAIHAALAINRPLLVRGEPGVGKSQLAKAAATALQRTYIPFVVTASTEAKDLLWTFDAVARLADAQIEGALCKKKEDGDKARKNLQLDKYIRPGPLWAALNWSSAKKQYEDTAVSQIKNSSPLPHYLNAAMAEKNGVVVLIDEIDKADSSVPNGLLEVLGANRFHPEGFESAVELDDNSKVKPLIIITTNEERILPDAFIRRCLSVTLKLPESRQDQVNYLVTHAKPNFKKLVDWTEDDNDNTEKQTVLEAAAKMVLDDRQRAKDDNLRPLPGQAEYFDLLRGLQALIEDNGVEEVRKLLSKLSRFTSKKHPDFPRTEEPSDQ